MLRVFNYLFPFSALLVAFPLCSMTQKNTYIHFLPADIFGIANQYLVRNCATLEELKKLYETYRDLELPYKRIACAKEFKLFFERMDQVKLAQSVGVHPPGRLLSPNNQHYINDLLLNAVLANKEELVSILLLFGSVEYREEQNIFSNNRTHTLLCHAAQCGYVKLTALLLKSGADPNPHKAISMEPSQLKPASPLICALQGNTRNTKAIAKLLLEAGAEPDLPDANHRTAANFLAIHPFASAAQTTRELFEQHRQRKIFHKKTFLNSPPTKNIGK